MENLTIMLVCNAGMSTSLLVTKMVKAAKEKGIEANIFAGSATEVTDNLEREKVDIILLGPQVRFMKSQLEKQLSGKEIPIEIINTQDYGMMKGEKILDFALEIIEQ